MTERDCDTKPGAFRGTPFHSSTAARNASPWWYGWGGYVVPDVYTGPFEELRATRSAVSMNEMSPIPKIEVRGSDARACVDYLITRDASRMEAGCAWYTPWCTGAGKVVADGIVFCFEPERFVFSGDRCEMFFRDHVDGFEVEIEDVTDDHGILAIQPAGEYAIDIARVEAGLILISADYTSAGPDTPSADTAPNPTDFVTPYELGLGHCVKLDKAADFVGREALAAEHRRGPDRRMVGLTFDVAGIVKLSMDAGRAPDVSPRVRWDHLPLCADDGVVGRASSVTWSPSTSQLIGFGLVPAGLAEAGTELAVVWADYWGQELGLAAARVCEYPFIDLGRQV